jgi:peptide-methionine (S)-S-oxide reductase
MKTSGSQLARFLPVVLFVAAALLGCAGRANSVGSAAPSVSETQAASPVPAFPDPPKETAPAKGTQIAVLSGGCFWGIEGVFERLKGVTDVQSGYSGGDAATAQYEMVSTGSTGHAESVQVTFDPGVISYGTLLKIFFSIAHDPTELNFQGPDHGTQYRSVIFYASDAQKKTAEDYITLLDTAHVFQKPIVTQVVPLKTFYPAEDYHQKFMDNNPDYPYIVAWDLPKVRALQSTWPALLSGKYPRL